MPLCHKAEVEAKVKGDATIPFPDRNLDLALALTSTVRIVEGRGWFCQGTPTPNSVRIRTFD
jgi:hypothetical protein